MAEPSQTSIDPKITVFTTIWNGALYFKPALRAVMRQTFYDVVEPDWLETLHGFLKAHPELDFAGSSTRHIAPDGGFLKVRKLGRNAVEMH